MLAGGLALAGHQGGKGWGTMTFPLCLAVHRNHTTSFLGWPGLSSLFPWAVYVTRKGWLLNSMPRGLPQVKDTGVSLSGIRDGLQVKQLFLGWWPEVWMEPPNFGVPFIRGAGRLKLIVQGINALPEKSGDKVAQVTVRERSPVLFASARNPWLSPKSQILVGQGKTWHAEKASSRTKGSAYCWQ